MWGSTARAGSWAARRSMEPREWWKFAEDSVASVSSRPGFTSPLSDIVVSGPLATRYDGAGSSEATCRTVTVDGCWMRRNDCYNAEIPSLLTKSSRKRPRSSPGRLDCWAVDMVGTRKLVEVDAVRGVCPQKSMWARAFYSSSGHKLAFNPL